MSSEPNPFAQVYAALWDTVTAHPACNRLVRTGNRIRYDGESRNPIKEAVSDVDLSELQLVLDGGKIELTRTSASTQVVKRYQFILATGDLRINERLHPVEWMLLEALCDVLPRMAALRWQERSFVRRVDVTDLAEGFSDAARNRGIRGWTAVCGIEVEMHLQTSALLAWKN